MDTSNSEQSRPNYEVPDKNILRLVAFAAMTITIATAVIFGIVAACLLFFRPDLGDQPVIAPLMGAVLVAGTMVAMIGLFAGVVDLSSSRDSKSMTLVSILVNGTFALLVCTVVLTGFLRS
ncbi:hypothetical protein KOR42_20060 [Thalassoglobus neptunius]|uniref:Uncharacterized protein n=1 Tax=Thalassoglobus neptunius TaxID=1938619 RepID=A0A5C5X6U9_9PLAN|nr:hypothetical protein [Thalassoglobus neptunius]TWT58624.1 hypothetical protein KOR42_20060 [Thalassoglobus neptunius]